MKEQNDKRRRLRIPFEATARLRFESLDTVLSARMKNISMAGIFAETDQVIPEDTPCRVEVIVTAPNSKVTMETEGYVARRDSKGLGIAFHHNMEWFAFFSIFEYYGNPSAAAGT